MGRKISGNCPSIKLFFFLNDHYQKPHQTIMKSFSPLGSSVLPKPIHNSPVGSLMNELFHMDFRIKGQNALIPFNTEEN